MVYQMTKESALTPGGRNRHQADVESQAENQLQWKEVAEVRMKLMRGPPGSQPVGGTPLYRHCP
jgi:hypothetical protein